MTCGLTPERRCQSGYDNSYEDDRYNDIRRVDGMYEQRSKYEGGGDGTEDDRVSSEKVVGGLESSGDATHLIISCCLIWLPLAELSAWVPVKDLSRNTRIPVTAR